MMGNSNIVSAPVIIVSCQGVNMLKHIVMWKLKETAEGAGKAVNAAKMKDMLDACSALVPGILNF
jgi:hypothetical protein